MATRASTKLAGAFPPGTSVRLVAVEGPEVLRPGPQHETVSAETVGEDGVVEFKGLEPGGRYFAVGYVNGWPVERRLTARADKSEDFSLAEMYGDPGVAARTKLSDGTWLDEEPKQHQKPDVPDGATWLGQHQVPKGVLQRSDTPRGSAHIVTGEERERANKQWRRQEPTSPIVETTPEDAGESSVRTGEPRDESPAKSEKG